MQRVGGSSCKFAETQRPKLALMGPANAIELLTQQRKSPWRSKFTPPGPRGLHPAGALARTHRNHEYKTNPTKATEKQSLKKTSGRVPRTPTRGSGATVGYLKKGYPKQRPKNRINRTHVVSAEIPDSPEAPSPRPLHPRPPRRGLRGSTDSLIRPRPPRRGLRGSNESPICPSPPRRGLRRSTDSPIRARPARHQPCDHCFDRTALAGHHIQSKHSTTPTDARRHSTAKWPTGRQSRQHLAICDGTEQGLPTTVLPNSCTKDNATWGVRTGFL